MKEPLISVGIMSEEEIHFRLEGKFLFEQKEYSGTFRACIEGNNIKLFCDDTLLAGVFEELIMEPSSFDNNRFVLNNVTIGKQFHWERQEQQVFQGSLRLFVEDEQITVVNMVPMEAYILSVISSEMSATSSLEFLKVHAVISRSWLMAQLQKERKTISGHHEKKTHSSIVRWYDRDVHQHYDVCADDHCQRYQGIDRISNPNVQNAVQDTRGIFLTFKGKICDTRFSKCCGGFSEQYENVWDEFHYPYLSKIADNDVQTNEPDLQKKEPAKTWIKNRPAAFCNTKDVNILKQVLNDYDFSTKDFYRWKITYSQQEIAAILRQKSGIDFGNILALVPIKRGVSGRLILLKIVGTKKKIIVGKELEIRRLLSPSHLYSSAFWVETLDLNGKIPQQFNLYGAGWGHGVGLCQIGAAVMAAKGYDFDVILRHYFKDAELRRLY